MGFPSKAAWKRLRPTTRRGDWSIADVTHLAGMLRVPLLDEDIEVVTARLNGLQRVLEDFDDLPWQEEDPIAWIP